LSADHRTRALRGSGTMIGCCLFYMSIYFFRRAAIGLTLLSSLPLSAQSAESKAEQHFAAAQQAQQAGLLDKAAQEYQAVLKVEPNVAEVYANLGLVYYAQSRFSESSDALAAAAKLKPGLEGVNLWLGVDYIKLGQPAKSVPLLQKAVRLAPTDLKAQRWLGTALWDSGQKTAAIEQLVKTTGLFPADLDSYSALGEAYRKAGDDELESVLAAASGTPLVHQIYADIYRDQHAWVRAAAHEREALKQDPAWKDAHLGLGLIHLAQNQLAEAKSEFNEELRVDPASAAARTHLAELALLNGDSASAMPLLQRAVQLSPYRSLASLDLKSLSSGDPGPDAATFAHLQQSKQELQNGPHDAPSALALAIIDRRLSASALSHDIETFDSLVEKPVAMDTYHRAVNDADRDKYREAETLLRTWIASHPADLHARYLFAQMLKQLSLQTLNHMVAIDPDSPRVHQMLGQTYAERSEEDKALAEYRLVEKAEPSLPGIHYEIGHLLWQFGDREKALTELHRELELNPYHAEANGEIGSILVVQNQPAEAIPFLRTALKLDPSLQLAHQQLGKAYTMQKDYGNAEKELLLAAKSDVDGSAHYQLWVVYRAEGRKEEAAKAIEICQKIRSGRLAETPNASREAVAP
jgi:tetratricopeptide (TPR) repeat protein